MMTNVMSWDEWAACDATAMAELIKKGEVTPTALAQQAAQATARINPQLSAAVELFDDAIMGYDPDPHFLRAHPLDGGEKIPDAK